MDHRQVDRSGLTVSLVGLGGNNFGSRCDLDQTRAVVNAALDVGITLIDTSDTYGNRGGSETLLGQVLKGRRDQMMLATKFGMDMGGGPDEARGSRWYLRRAIAASLRRLQTDFVDLYQLHRPDPRTPIDETLGALDELVVEGKVRYLGSSNLVPAYTLVSDCCRSFHWRADCSPASTAGARRRRRRPVWPGGSTESIRPGLPPSRHSRWPRMAGIRPSMSATSISSRYARTI
jgi:aryl-alcohol dehydrogenase-like predicted oxidoreductase